MSLLLADIGKLHFVRLQRLADKFFGDGSGLAVPAVSPAVACGLLRFSAGTVYDRRLFRA